MKDSGIPCGDRVRVAGSGRSVLGQTGRRFSGTSSTLDVIPRRYVSRMHSRSLDEAEIVRLYVDERRRADEIAYQLGCTTSLVYERLERAGVTRTRRAPLPIEELTCLYVDDGWSSTAIGKKFNVAGSTVRSLLRVAGITVHRMPSARRRDVRRQCPNSVVFRAYALGLVWGDFAVEQRRPASRGLRIKTSTTRHEQVDLTKRVFGRFGSVSHVNRFLSVSLTRPPLPTRKIRRRSSGLDTWR